MKSVGKLFGWVAWRALGETMLLEAVLLAALLSFGGQAPPNVLSQGILFLIVVCVLWFALRAPVKQGKLFPRAVCDFVNAVILTLFMALWALLLVMVLNLRLVYMSTNLGRGVEFFYLLSGFLFLVVRVAGEAWRYWSRLRSRKLIWSLTHAQLTVVVISVMLVAIVLSVVTLFDASRQYRQEATPAATILDRLVLTAFPLVGITVAFVGLTLAMVLPPAALVSYSIAKRITLRLARLATAAQRLRGGQYDARVAVVGEDEVAQLQTDFNAMAEDLQNTLVQLAAERDKVTSLLEARRTLTASVSHELRTPVATARSYLEPMLARWGDDLPDGLRSELIVIDREVLRLERLIEDLFTLSQAEVRKLELRLAPLDCGPVAARMVDTLGPLAWGQKRVKVVCEIEPGLAPAQADEGRLEQILTNLLRNAIRHTPLGGIVAVQVGEQEDFIRFDIRDTGAGIPAEALPFIWDRFYRLTEAAVNGEGVTTGQGAGLGLALVKELVEAMGGYVAVESQVSLGSCFTICLPTANLGDPKRGMP
ncbi:sensor histidine kinase [Chloroflexota bacterium]